MRIKEIQIKVCYWFDKVNGNTYSSGVGHVWDWSGGMKTVRLPFAYGSEPKRKLLLKMFEDKLIPADTQSELEYKLGWVVEVIDYGECLKGECVEFGKSGCLTANINY